MNNPLWSVAALTILWVMAISNTISVHACSQSCNNFSPNNCLNQISSFSNTGFSTSGLSDQITPQCGSGQSGLNDRVFQFSVTTSGLYTVNTFNIGSSDSVLQINGCDGSFIGCNDDKTNNDFSSFLQVPLDSGTQYVAVVQKYDSNTNSLSFGLSIAPVCTCSSFTPNACLGTVGANGLTATGFNTGNATRSQIKMTCGSTQSGLNDFIFQFQVATSGTYVILTDKIGSGDPTMSLMDCNGGSVLACNDDRAPGDKRSEIVVALTAGSTYVGAVSRAFSNISDVAFDVSIKLATLSPTTAPTTASPTSAAPTTQPSFAPTESPVVTQEPTLSPSAPNTTVNGGAPSDTPNGDNLASNQFIFIGSGVGGGVALFALGLLVHRRRVRRRQSLDQERWTTDEESKLRETYRNTHDFDVLCGTFPHKSRESVALKLKTLMADKANPSTLDRKNAAMLLAPSAEEKYVFVKDTPPTPAPAPPEATLPPQRSAKITSPITRVSDTVSRISYSFAQTVTTTVRKAIAPPPGLGHDVHLTASNPLYITVPLPPPPPPSPPSNLFGAPLDV